MSAEALLRAQAAQLRSMASALDAQADLLEEPPPAADREDAEQLVGRPAGIPVRTWRVAIHRGELAATKIGREYRARRRDVEEWISSKQVEPRAPAPPRPRVLHEPADELERTLARVAAGGR